MNRGIIRVSSQFKFFQSRLAVRFLSSNNEPRIAVVGSGPAGLFTCASLLRRFSCKIDVFDASPVPFGLVRYGVAPDHQEVKNCIHGFEKMFDSNPGKLSLYCNVRIGSDITFEELSELYDGILLAYGAHRPRRLNIPGADSANIFSGSDFVSWYNGVPGAKAPLLNGKNVVIIGNGNVALDCARVIGMASSLRTTDIPYQSQQILDQSRVNNIRIVGRRGPTQTSFTIKELREQFRLPEWVTSVQIDQDELTQIKDELATMERKKKRLLQVLIDGVKDKFDSEKHCQFLFHRIPQQIIADQNGRVSSVRVRNERSKSDEELACDLLIYSIGYETVVLPGVPKNEKGSIAMKDDCRVDYSSCAVYATGWCAHGPKGVIVDSQQQATFVAETIANDLKSREGKGSNALSILNERGIGYISWKEWKRMDEEEIKRGQEHGKVREKITHFDEYVKKR